MRARSAAIEQLWNDILTSISVPLHFNLYFVDMPKDEVFRCNSESWTTIIGIIKKLDIRYIEHSSTEIELIAPDAPNFSLRISIYHYEDEEFDFSELEGMAIDEAIEKLKRYQNNPSESFDYVFIHFNPSAMIHPGRVLTISPTDKQFWNFMVAAKEKLDQTAEILRNAIEMAPEPTRTRAIKEQENIKRYENLSLAIRHYITDRCYDKEFSISPARFDDASLTLRINDSYMCTGVIQSSSFENDLDELFEFGRHT